ncbi:MAG TPA: rRNA maturation RNase YbeY [Brumimicrobium sp.]|nr:rRNA maturation RNase YbeY [Brumimicrobium sp.]
MIEFHFVDVPPIDLKHIEKWYELVCEKEGKQLGPMSVVLGTDEWLLEQNKRYLNHDFYTDIITFDYTEANVVSGDLLISKDRVNENALTYNVSRETELNRVVVHGLLHLIGYKDESEEESKIMREKEDFYLSLL